MAVSTASDWMQVSCSQAYLMCDSEVLILKLWSGDNDGVITTVYKPFFVYVMFSEVENEPLPLNESVCSSFCPFPYCCNSDTTQVQY